MSSRAFRTYDAMRAAIGSNRPRQFWAGISSLAKRNNTSEDTELRGVQELEARGWIVFCQRKHDALGHQYEVVYDVLDHAEWLAAHPSRTCPDKPLKKMGPKAHNLVRTMRRIAQNMTQQVARREAGEPKPQPCESLNRNSAEPKPQSCAAYSANVRLPIALQSLKEPERVDEQTHTHKPSASPVDGGVCAGARPEDRRSDFDKLMDELPEEMKNSQWKKKDRDREKLDALIADLGWKKVCALVHLYRDNHPDVIFLQNSIFKWGAFLDNFRQYLPKADAVEKWQEKVRYDATPEGKTQADENWKRKAAEYRAQFMAKVEEYRKELGSFTPEEQKEIDDTIARCDRGIGSSDWSPEEKVAQAWYTEINHAGGYRGISRLKWHQVKERQKQAAPAKLHCMMLC